jgi:hypothetical protein
MIRFIAYMIVLAIAAFIMSGLMFESQACERAGGLLVRKAYGVSACIKVEVINLSKESKR